MKRLTGIFTSTLTSGGIVGHGSAGAYIGDVARRGMGLHLSMLKDGNVRYLAKNTNILKRAMVQYTSQLAYGMLRSYPRYLKYWEQKERDKFIESSSQTSVGNKEGLYFRLIEEQKAVPLKKNYRDQVVGSSTVLDYLEISITKEGVYFDRSTGKMEPNSEYGLVSFVDLQPSVQVTSKNNILLTTVQGRDYTRKELVSGGDFEITISGTISTRFPDVYPEADVSRFLKLMQYRGVLNCENTILRQFHISRLIVLNYTLGTPSCRNVQPYSLSCVAVEPDERIRVKPEIEVIEREIYSRNKWVDVLNYAGKVVEPTLLLKLTQKWI